ncbi:MAG: methionine biosynthesis protein MetW [Gammaproteobacteria bacterium]|nr:methionine biosynthesis protein MetW [Gammaproteobacteria bacterium]
MTLRPDQSLIASWIRPRAHVLDLGCGDGTLLCHLREARGATGYGLEIDAGNILKCLEAGVHVIQYDLDAGLASFKDNSFDYVIMSQTLQAIRYPRLLLAEMLRVGREGIVTFPNLGYWQCRRQFALAGRMPRTQALPFPWYETPHIHPCTIDDFETLCRAARIELVERTTVDHAHRSGIFMRLLPNLMGEVAIYRIRLGPDERDAEAPRTAPPQTPAA